MIAELGLRISSDGAVQGKQALDALAVTAGKTEAQVVGLGAASDRMSEALRKAGQATTQVQQRIGQMVGGFDKVGRSARESAQAFEEIARTRAGIDQLRASLDPLYASSMRYEQAVEQIEQAVRSGAITQRQANVVLQQAERSYLAVGRQAVPALVRGARDAGGAMQRLGPQIQNASFQIGDFAVQVASGTAASRAFAQQAPQLLGGFGVIGAAAGAAVAVGAALVPLLINMGDEAETTADMIDALGEAMERLRDATDAARQPFTDLISEYGRGAAQAQGLLEIQRQLAQLDTANQLQSLQDAIAETFGAFEEIRDADTGQTLFSGLETRLLRLRSELDLTAEEAVAVQAGLDALATAQGPTEQAAAAQRLREQLVEAAGGVDLLNREGRAFLGELLEMEGAALRFAAVDIVSGISTGADEAARLAQNMFSAASAKAAFADQATRTAAPPNELGFGLGSVGDPSAGNADLAFGGTSGPRGYVRPAPENMRFEYNADGTLKTKGSRGGGGASAAQKEHNERLREAERIFSDTRTAAEEYSAELADLSELQQMGYLDAETYARAVDKLNESFRETETEQLRQGIENISSSIADAIVSGEDLGEAFRGILRQMASDILSSGIQQLLTNMLTPQGGGGGGGFLGAIVSAIGGGVRANADGNAFLNGDIIPHARGGIVDQMSYFPMSRGRVGSIAEEGPEAIMPLSRGADGKLGVAAQQPVTRVEVVPSPYFDVTVDGRAQNVAGRMDAQVARGMHRTNGPRLQNYQRRGTN